MLSINNLTYRIQGRELFEDASVVLPTGSKTGFVGKNGTGKTTLFHLIQEHIHPDAGGIELVKKARIGAVAQEAPAGNETVLDVVMSADKERTALMAEAETATDPDRIGEIYIRLADIDAYTAEARASSILKGLGFEQDRQNSPTHELSGGWRMRVALAGVLFSQPDLLLLDEPTNYLDLEGTLWLEKYLSTYPYTVFMISHDRDLLNKSVNSIIHLEHRKLTFYKGNYDTFESTRRMQMELNNKGREKSLDQIAHMQKFVDRFGASATKAKQAQARMKMIAKLKPPAAMFDEYSAPFTFPQPKTEQATPMISLDGASAGYGDKTILRHINMRIDPGDRIALIGVNGNGKSTFAKLLAGDIKPMGGTFAKGKKLEIAHFAQHQMDKLKPEWTPFEHIVDIMPTDSESRRRSRLSQMGLTKSRMDTLAKNLSGGERARLLMGLITFSGPGMMILDEPTNHLDIDSRDALVHALNDYEGAVLIISHDRHLIEATCDTLWIAEGGTIRVLDEDLDSYQNSITSAKESKGGTKAERKANKQEAAAKRAEIAPIKSAIKDAETKIARLKREIDKIDAQLEDPKVYNGSPEQVIVLGKDKARFSNDLEATEEQWLALSAELETAESA
ncbi:ABC-F family ATP-binding cassette domain-containing protein [Devosia sp. J2-20]|jgi:ATP-binding cassette, subfamily F, member 3|uniref:ABC-F family ATP-binding cassette domain-containing protein n=1 Tax=Devosia TaxID=46913 RepID=UPI0022AFF546|nr:MULTISPECIES: ABC-F family ATP-binding cassette domain-containing protein [Devosia]MCZ4346100.1 ABC-F family ATP-binding cassette domain-containing protein [Devosia neptuniae]WDQ98006.1 ABC-F family ATP-binding cassette domain-containing protein [Devosia sp. J2-20]|tara:strand:+ start:121817 stop:123679 length:1863 start_codon:yes stop_codon:yes gene_type:complete